MKARLHGDVYGNKYLCLRCNAMHEFAPPKWSDLVLCRRIPKDMPPEEFLHHTSVHHNLFRDIALDHKRNNGGKWSPYPNAPASYACAPEGPVGYIEVKELLSEFPAAEPTVIRILERRAAIHKEETKTTVDPSKRFGGRKRIWLHGDISQDGTSYYCEHHESFHPISPRPVPYPTDLKYARRAFGRSEVIARGCYRPKGSKCKNVWYEEIVHTKKGPQPTTPKGWCCDELC